MLINLFAAVISFTTAYAFYNVNHPVIVAANVTLGAMNVLWFIIRQTYLGRY